MQYQFNERYEYVKYVEFLNSQPLHILKIRYFKEDGVSGVFEKKEFRYSFDKVVWSPWNTLTQGNLAGIQFKDNRDFYLNIRYHRTGINSGNIQRWYLIYDEFLITPPITPSDSSINADYLRGEGPDYYLYRGNHYGPYTNLSILNVPDGSSPGVYSHRADSSVGSEFFFKRIEGGDGITVTDSGGGKIIISSDSSGGGSGVYESIFDPSVKMPNSVGGISANTAVSDLEGKTFSQLFDELLFPTAYPSLTNPSATFSISPSSLQEIGSIINITATATFNRGSISPQYSASSPYRSGLPNNYDYEGTGLSDVSSSSLSNVQTINNYTVIPGNQPNWQSRIYYDGGVQPYDSKGNPYNSPLSTGVTSFISRTFEGVYPIFATTVNITVLTKQSLVSMISGNNIIINLVGEISLLNRQTFELPNDWLSSRPLIGIQQYNTLTLAWEYPGGSAAASLLIWSVSSSTEVIQGNTINYTKYTYNGIQRSSVQIRLIF